MNSSIQEEQKNIEMEEEDQKQNDKETILFRNIDANVDK